MMNGLSLSLSLSLFRKGPERLKRTKKKRKTNFPSEKNGGPAKKERGRSPSSSSLLEVLTNSPLRNEFLGRSIKIDGLIFALFFISLSLSLEQGIRKQRFGPHFRPKPSAALAVNLDKSNRHGGALLKSQRNSKYRGEQSIRRLAASFQWRVHKKVLQHIQSGDESCSVSSTTLATEGGGDGDTISLRGRSNDLFRGVGDE